MSNIDSLYTESTLFVDVGNSSIKTGYLSKGKWSVATHATVESAGYLINNHAYPLKEIIVSSVRENLKDALYKEIGTRLVRELRVSQIKADQLDYETPETLGIDRFLACLGASRYSEKSVLVIDAGTACTIDFMDQNGVYKGGVIVPGLGSVMRIFKEQAPALPEVPVEIPEVFPGKSTKESLQWGQVVFFTDGVKSILKRYLEIFGEYELFITGGDAVTLNQLLSEIGSVKKTLVFDGMAKFIQ